MNNRTLIVKFDDNSVKRISFPEEWTVTFSGFIPKMNDRGYGISRPSLRIYGKGKKQMACFTNVDMFREESIEVEVLKKSELEDLYWVPQMELDLAPSIVKGEIKEKDYQDEDYEVEISMHPGPRGEEKIRKSEIDF